MSKGISEDNSFHFFIRNYINKILNCRKHNEYPILGSSGFTPNCNTVFLPVFMLNLVETSDSVDQFHAILFHQRSLTLKDKPSRRRPEQRYVHWSFESPVHTFYDLTDLKDLNNFFNWSMTYRLDSDFPVPYGEIQLVQHQTKSERDDHFLYL